MCRIAHLVLISLSLGAFLTVSSVAEAGCSPRDLIALVTGKAFRPVPQPRLETLRATRSALVARRERAVEALRAGLFWHFRANEQNPISSHASSINFLGWFVSSTLVSFTGAAAVFHAQTNPLYALPIIGGSVSVGFVAGMKNFRLFEILAGPVTYPYRRLRRGNDATPARVEALDRRIQLLDEEEAALLASTSSAERPAIFDAAPERSEEAAVQQASVGETR